MDLPKSFCDKMENLLGDEFEDFLASYDNVRMYGLRVNTSKISNEEFEKIVPFEVKKIPWIPNGYFYAWGKGLTGQASFLSCRSVLSSGAKCHDTGKQAGR